MISLLANLLINIWDKCRKNQRWFLNQKPRQHRLRWPIPNGVLVDVVTGCRFHMLLALDEQLLHGVPTPAATRFGEVFEDVGGD